VLEEAQVDYDLVVIDLRTMQRPKELLRINQYGRVPVLIDGDVAIDQSLAILIYLAEKLQRLLPTEEPGRSEALRLLMFVATDIMFGHSAIFRLLRRSDGRYESIIGDYRQRLLGDIATCNGLLAEREYLGGGAISIADLMLYSIVGQYASAQIKHHGFTALHEWIERIRQRPSIQIVEKKCPYAYDVSTTMGETRLLPDAGGVFRPTV
jgi:glutathione S-transferase